MLADAKARQPLARKVAKQLVDVHGVKLWQSADVTENADSLNRCQSIELCNPDVSRVRVVWGASPDALRSKNVAAPENDDVTSRNPVSVHHCGRTILYASYRRIEDMVIGTVVFVAFVVATGAAIVKAFEWYLDVLHGP